MNIFTYSGRIGRAKYLIGLAVAAVVSGVIGLLYFLIAAPILLSLLIKGGGAAAALVSMAGIIVGFIPVLLSSFLIVKRFHDVDKSGRWFFALLIPIYNIHLAVGLLTEKGTIGTNTYGEDPLPGETADDVFNRFSKDGIARIIVDILVIGIFLASMALSFAGKVKEKVVQRKAIDNIIQNAVDAASGKSTSPDTGGSVSFPSVPLAQKLSTSTKDWKTGEIKKEFNSGNGISSICYTIKYPSNFQSPYESRNAYLNRSQTQFSSVSKPAISVFIDSQIGGYINDFLVKDSGWLAYDVLGRTPQKYQTKDFKTPYGLDATEIVGDDGFWFMYLTFSEKEGNIVLGLHPPTPMDGIVATSFPDVRFGEAMANTLRPASCTP